MPVTYSEYLALREVRTDYRQRDTVPFNAFPEAETMFVASLVGSVFTI